MRAADRERRATSLDRGLAAVLSALGVAGLLTFAATVGGRVGASYPLEWMEGGSLHHALRLVHGEPLYVAPSARFVPYLYPPLGYVPMAVSIALFGPTLPAARWPSLACTLLSLAFIHRICTREAGRRSVGLAAAGLFAAGFGYTGAFLDLARIDACFVALVLGGAERLYAGKTRSALALLALSAFAKQHGFLVFLAVAAALAWQDPRRHLRSAGLLLLSAFAAYLALDLGSSGYFHRYCVALPFEHAVGWRLLVSFFFVDVLVYLPVLALGAALRARELRLDPRNALLAAALLVSALGRAHQGGFDNVRLPAFALLCVVGAALLGKRIFDVEVRPGVRVLAALGLSLQLALLWQPPSAHWPSARSAPQFRALRESLRRCAGSGEAVALDYALLTGVPFVHTMALSDLRDARDRTFGRVATDRLLGVLQAQDGPAAVAVGERFPELLRALRSRYHECARVTAPEVPTGYRPGFVLGEQYVQVVYAR